MEDEGTGGCDDDGDGEEVVVLVVVLDAAATLGSEEAADSVAVAIGSFLGNILREREKKKGLNMRVI